jgi:hypothetical protein
MYFSVHEYTLSTIFIPGLHRMGLGRLIPTVADNTTFLVYNGSYPIAVVLLQAYLTCQIKEGRLFGAYGEVDRASKLYVFDALIARMSYIVDSH